MLEKLDAQYLQGFEGWKVKYMKHRGYSRAVKLFDSLMVDMGLCAFVTTQNFTHER